MWMRQFKLKRKLMAEGRTDLSAWHEARPPFLEAEASSRYIYFAEVTGCPLLIVHISAKEVIPILAQAKAKGLKVYGETCPQYLTLTKDGPYGVLGKVNPPLRTPEDNEALWEAVRLGLIEHIGSDHAACATKHKRELWEAIVGFAGVETMLPVMISEGVNKGRIGLEKLTEIMSYNNAKLFGLLPRKGIISVGADADIVILNLKKILKIRADKLHHISDFTPFEGMEVKGWPEKVFVKGQLLSENGELVGKPIGTYIKCGSP